MRTPRAPRSTRAPLSPRTPRASPHLRIRAPAVILARARSSGRTRSDPDMAQSSPINSSATSCWGRSTRGSRRQVGPVDPPGTSRQPVRGGPGFTPKVEDPGPSAHLEGIDDPGPVAVDEPPGRCCRGHLGTEVERQDLFPSVRSTARAGRRPRRATVVGGDRGGSRRRSPGPPLRGAIIRPCSRAHAGVPDQRQVAGEGGAGLDRWTRDGQGRRRSRSCRHRWSGPTWAAARTTPSRSMVVTGRRPPPGATR